MDKKFKIGDKVRLVSDPDTSGTIFKMNLNTKKPKIFYRSDYGVVFHVECASSGNTIYIEIDPKANRAQKIKDLLYGR